MQDRSDTWKALAETGTFILNSVAIIDGVEYVATSAPVISRGLFSDKLSVGNCTSASLSLCIMTDDDIAKSAEIKIQQKLLESVGGTESEYLPAGTFYISKRSKDYSSGLLTLTCYDAMLKANEDYFLTVDEIDDAEWPQPMSDIVSNIAARMGVSIDARTVIQTGDAYVVPCPDEKTMMDVLGYVAAAHGGNWIISPAGELRLVPLATAPTDDSTDAMDVTAVLSKLTTGQQLVVSGVSMTDEYNNSYTAGDDSGFVVEITGNPCACQTITDNLYTMLNGLTYNPFTMDQAIYDPAAELGDQVLYNGLVYSFIAVEDATLSVAFQASISAPSGGELEDEYPYLSEQAKQINALNNALANLDTDTDISVGGRNYALTSGDYTEESDLSNWLWYLGGLASTDNADNDYYSLTACDGYAQAEKTAAITAGHGLFLKLSDDVDFSKGIEYTISVKLRMPTGTSLVPAVLDAEDEFIVLPTTFTAEDDDWHLYSYTFTPSDHSISTESDLFGIGFNLTNTSLAVGDCLDIAYVKLEKGNTVTDWTTAPEDTVSQMQSLANGRTTTYYADTAPEGDDFTQYDIWFDTANGYTMYYWTGKRWAKAPFGTGALGEGSVTEDIIATGAVTAGKIAVDYLSAIIANVGELNAGIIHSTDYDAKTNEGMLIDLDNGTININNNFIADADGLVTLVNATVSGSVTTENDIYKTSISGGIIQVYHNGTVTGKFGSTHRTDDDTKYGATLAALNSYLSLGYGSSDDVANTTSAYILNNGLNPDNRTERHIFYGKSYHTDNIRFANNCGICIENTDGVSSDMLYLNDNNDDLIIGNISYVNNVYIRAKSAVYIARGVKMNNNYAIQSATADDSSMVDLLYLNTSDNLMIGNASYINNTYLRTAGDIYITRGSSTVRLPEIVVGRTSATLNATSGTVDVEFGYTFSAAPYVVVTVRHNSTNTITARIKTVTTTGCTLYFTTGTTGITPVFNWVAAY